jgi:hypothetical protein
MTLFVPATPADPVADKDAAETFAEDGVSLFHTDTIRSAAYGGVALAGSPTGNSISVTESNVITRQRASGVELTIDNAVAGLEVTPLPGTTADTVLLTETDGTIIASKPLDGTTQIRYGMDPGRTVHVSAWSGGSTDYDEAYNNTVSYPLDGTDFTAERAVDGLGSTFGGTNLYNFATVESVQSVASGSVTVEWPSPPDLYAWDVAVFQRTLDSESVEVYIEEDQSGGWTEVAGPIARGDSIPADPGNNVRYRVEISASDTANNPRLDAIYRRFKL